MSHITLIVPELYFLLLVVALMIQSCGTREWKPDVEKWLPFGAGLGFFVSIVAYGSQGYLFWDVYKVDMMSQFFKIVIAFGFYVVVLNASRKKTISDEKRTDYYMLLGFSTFGLMLLASCVELITIYLALELASYSMYAIIPLRAKSKGAAEAGVKYILFGAVATALALYGLSYIMASQHTTYIAELAGKNWHFADNPMAVAGLCLFLGGMFFKLALFPFHFWCPDVYQGASNETAAFVATMPKMGAIVVLVRMATFLKPGLEVTTLLAVLGACSMTFGNLSALVQTDLKRLLGFSSVAHAGYIMVGLVSGTPEGLAAAAFYALAYLVMNLLVFWIISRVAVDGRNLKLHDLNGLYKKAPVLAFSLAAGAFALVGLPPTMGFMGKFFLITSAWGHGYNWLVIVLVLNSALAIYYYLGLFRHAFTEDTASDSSPVPDNGWFASAGAGMLAAAVLLAGIIPAPLFNFAVAAGKSLFGIVAVGGGH
ncbi:NADH-quinone oxidoreductase subunit N [Pseudodesulfovibrio piezophilus]|uniref:NADH-quinone oxidoreductase subunit N n=1 Tax=Pseudodesulfovibrio piezophilus (strain DSM 21447 / JCM 15486 / C1TLV30) TaxID=1322246 RepID=M1WP47_PSEP2|nr:NADH-quinone oxidoreductase subunit N [Pseudodesulfovibrio piezophilus]CCH48039.1 NADH-quinone oxidoreductase subunit N 2 [Pseudodesulfovibrio piezophilus C1TLV30]